MHIFKLPASAASRLRRNRIQRNTATGVYHGPFHGLLISYLALLIGCSGSADQAAPSAVQAQASFSLAGRVSAGSVGAAELELVTADGTPIASVDADSSGHYELSVPSNTELPLKLVTRGGNDLVVAEPPDVLLQSVVLETGDQILNLSPFTTLASRMAECGGSVSQDALNRAWSIIRSRLNMGLERNTDPSRSTLTAAHAGQHMFAYQNLQEALRRTQGAMTAAGDDLTGEQTTIQIACDLMDDELLNASAVGSSPRLITVFRAAQAAVLMEAIAGVLHVEEQSAMPAMDDAVRSAFGVDTVSASDAILDSGVIGEAQAATTLFLTEYPDVELLDLAIALDDDPIEASDGVHRVLDARHLTMMWGLPERVALADEAALTELTARVDQSRLAGLPVVSFETSRRSAVRGQRTTLSWASVNADRCVAQSDWSGERPLTGTFTTPPLQRSSRFILNCIGLGGRTTRYLWVQVTDPGAPTQVSLAASNTAINLGGTTQLTWSSVNATNCTASGGWSGSRAVAGSARVGPLNGNRQFRLSCNGPTGSAAAAVAITVNPAPAPTPPPPSPAPTPAPQVSLTAAAATLPSGGRTVLSWTSSNASSCSASGAWSGTRARSGSQSIGPLSGSRTYQLLCSGSGGSTSAMVTVRVVPNPPAPPPPPTPTVTLSAAQTLVNRGASTTLSWSSSNATSCAASGGWSGNRATSGSANSPSISTNTTFTLTCSGSGGSAMTMVTVNVRGVVRLNWQPPTRNVDGSRLTDLAGYRVHYGLSPRNYTGERLVTNSSASSVSFNVAAGTYYVAMKALDRDGNESAYSNEVVKTTQ